MADTFTDNAFVQALGNHLGMTNLLSGDMGGAPDGGYGGGAPQGAPAKIPVPLPPKPSTEGSKTPREFRQHAPVARQGATKSSGGGSGLPLNLPGVMSPEVLMHPVVQGLLKQYGVDPTSAAQNADPNLFITNPEAFQHHPVLSGLLERGLEGAAFTKGGDTPGETISNIAQGFLESQAARANKYNNQLMMPFAQASQVAGLQTVSDEQKFKQAQAAHYQALEDHYNAMDDTRARLADIQEQRQHDLDDYHKGLLTVRNQMNMMKTPLDKAGSDEYKAIVDAAGGDPSKIDQTKLDDLLTRNAERVRIATEAGKDKRAAMQNNTRIKTTAMNNAGKTNTPANQQKKAAFDAASKRLEKFNQAMSNSMMTTFDGDTYTSGSTKAKAKVKELQDAVNSAKTAWENTQQMEPNTEGATPTRHRKFDINTGTIR